MHRGLLRDVLAGTSKGAAPRAGLLSTPRSMSVPGCVWFYLAPPPRLSLVTASVVPGPGAASPGTARPGHSGPMPVLSPVPWRA